MVNGEKRAGEAYIRQIIEEAGGFQAFRKQMDDFRDCQIRLDKERAALMEKYPDKWVAMGKDGVAAVNDSQLGLLSEIDGQGLDRNAVAVEYLDTDPTPLIL